MPPHPDPPILAFWAKKKKRGSPEKSGDSPPLQNPWNPWKREQKRTKKQGKPQNEKSEQNEKSKDWKVRVIIFILMRSFARTLFSRNFCLDQFSVIQRAENGGLDPSWLNLAFLGHPDVQSRGPKTLKPFKTSILETLDWKSGRPKNAKFNHSRSNPSFSALWLRSRPPFTGVLLGPGPESAPRSAFWAILGTCLGVPQRVLFECFLAFLGPKNAKKHSKSTLWGHSEAGAQNCPKSTPGALSGPGPKSTPVNGGRDRNPLVCYSGQILHAKVLEHLVWSNTSGLQFRSPCVAAKGGRQKKGLGKKATKKVTKNWPKTRKRLPKKVTEKDCEWPTL